MEGHGWRDHEVMELSPVRATVQALIDDDFLMDRTARRPHRALCIVHRRGREEGGDADAAVQAAVKKPVRGGGGGRSGGGSGGGSIVVGIVAGRGIVFYLFR